MTPRGYASPSPPREPCGSPGIDLDVNVGGKFEQLKGKFEQPKGKLNNGMEISNNGMEISNNEREISNNERKIRMMATDIHRNRETKL